MTLILPISKIDLGVDIFAQAAACCYALGASGNRVEASVFTAPERKNFYVAQDGK